MNFNIPKMDTTASLMPKSVVMTLMKKIGGGKEHCESTYKGVKHLRMPFGELCKSGDTIRFQKGVGFTNPLNHLRTCLAGGSKQK